MIIQLNADVFVFADADHQAGQDPLAYKAIDQKRNHKERKSSVLKCFGHELYLSKIIVAPLRCPHSG